jgi:type II secretory pathway component PulF
LTCACAAWVDADPRARGQSARPVFNLACHARDLISFCFHMQQIARANAPLLEGLKDLIASTENSRFRDLLALLADDLEGGKLLSEALASHPDVFDRVFVASSAPPKPATRWKSSLRGWKLVSSNRMNYRPNSPGA